MLVSKVRPDGVFGGFVEFPDGTTKIPAGHSFSLPPEIPSGYHAIMMGGWQLVEGEAPVWPKPPTEEELIQKFEEESIARTQERLDNFAQTRGYESILSACTYINSTIEKFRNEGTYCVASRDSTWSAMYSIIDSVKAKTRPVPSGFGEVESELPVLQWPDVGV